MSKSRLKREFIQNGGRQPDGLTKDLDDMATTMHYLESTCPRCGNRLVASTRRTYCHPCGVWWWP